jgi:hypothetical protein
MWCALTCRVDINIHYEINKCQQQGSLHNFDLDMLNSLNQLSAFYTVNFWEVDRMKM